MKIEKADKSSFAGTKADNDSTVQDLHVSQPIAKPRVSSRYVVRLCCGNCGNILNETSKMSKNEILKQWTSLVIGSAFASGKCKNGCRSTFSDCNINTELKIFDVVDAVYLDKAAFFQRLANGC